MIKWLQILTVIRVVWSFKVSSVLCICHSLNPPQGPWSSASKGLQIELGVICQVAVDKPKSAFEHQLCLSSLSLIPGELAGIVNLVLFHQHPLCSSCPCCHPRAESRAVLGEFSPWLHVSVEGAGGSSASAECSNPLKISVFWAWLMQEVCCSSSSFPHHCKGRKGEILEKQGWRLMEIIPVYSLQPRRQQPKSNPNLRANVQLEQNNPSAHG